MAPISFRHAVKILRVHYQVDTDSPRKLARLFPHESGKREAILAEAARIVALRERLGERACSCKLCGRIGPASHVCSRPRVRLVINPNRTRFRGWRRWSIDAPSLCRRCERIARSEIALYRQLVELYGLVHTLRSARHVPNHG